MNSQKKFLICNAVIPIIIGTIIYYMISPEVIFAQCVDELLGRTIHIGYMWGNSEVIRFIRNYLLDMMWAYALFFALTFVMGNNTVVLKKVFAVAFVFSTIMEFLQLTPIARGTFDFNDIIIECLAEVLAVCIIKFKLYKGGQAV